jgi:hypothetical protein
MRVSVVAAELLINTKVVAYPASVGWAGESGREILKGLVK